MGKIKKKSKVDEDIVKKMKGIDRGNIDKRKKRRRKKRKKKTEIKINKEK